MSFSCEILEENVKPIIEAFEKNNKYLAKKNEEVARLTYEASLLNKENIAILSELKGYAVLPEYFFNDFNTTFNKGSLTAKQKKEVESQKNLIVKTFFGETGLSEDEINNIKIVSSELLASRVGACCYYIAFSVPRFSLTDKIVLSVPTYNIAPEALESYCYKVGVDDGKNLNFVGHSVYLSEILSVLVRTFESAPLPAVDTDGDHVA